TPTQIPATVTAALRLRLHPTPVTRAEDLMPAFARISATDAWAAIALSDPATIDRLRTAIADLALKHGVPSAESFRDGPAAGCLLSYGIDLKDMHRHSAVFVDKILKGARPADLPVERPTKFELVLNLKTARALGIAIPQSVLQRADEVIE
ncbi:MAG TPA: ABC transporter substrate binding protein, partial [Vineibacter sp.]|nr:ABC transporter substrate binding protein [Vineibacter sp.]